MLLTLAPTIFLIPVVDYNAANWIRTITNGGENSGSKGASLTTGPIRPGIDAFGAVWKIKRFCLAGGWFIDFYIFSGNFKVLSAILTLQT